MIDSLDLTSSIDMEAMRDRRQAFARVHVGMLDVPIGSLLEGLRRDPVGLPPRSGHLGNWDEIARGRAGAMDFNQAICAGGYGYPLIYSFTQTEAESPRAGDWVYLPGSIVQGGRYAPLALHSWDGTRFVRRARDHALFSPFVRAEVDGQLVGLTRLHWQRMQGLAQFRFRHEAAVILEHEEQVRAILEHLLEAARTRDNPRRAFGALIASTVALDGTMSRCDIATQGAGYRLGKRVYASTAELVEAALVPFRAAADPDWLCAAIADLPSTVPVVGHILLGVLSAMFATPEGGTRPEGPVNVHLHWGARAMAGFPPRRRGYFMERSTARSMREICATLVDAFDDVQPLCVVLLPAATFMLCPGSAHPDDAELVGELLADAADPTLSAPEIEAITHRWLERRRDALSAYFADRFRAGSGLLYDSAPPAPSVPIEAPGFRTLTFRQACAIVGALDSAIGGQAPR